MPGERIVETDHFVAEQDFEYPIEAFVIIASKRHVKSITEFSEEERNDLMNLLVSCRKAIKTQLSIDEVTLVQEESSTSSHFHVWIFPWLPWMDEGGYKRKVGNIAAIMEEAKNKPKTEENIQTLRDGARKLKSEITKGLQNAKKRTTKI